MPPDDDHDAQATANDEDQADDERDAAEQLDRAAAEMRTLAEAVKP